MLLVPIIMIDHHYVTAFTISLTKYFICCLPACFRVHETLFKRTIWYDFQLLNLILFYTLIDWKRVPGKIHTVPSMLNTVVIGIWFQLRLYTVVFCHYAHSMNCSTTISVFFTKVLTQMLQYDQIIILIYRLSCIMNSCCIKT